jgi:AraC family transcriptional regulator
MLEEKLLVDNSSEQNSFPPVLSQLPVLSSHQFAWRGISLEHFHQPPGETPEYSVDHYIITMNIGQSFQCEQVIEGHYEKELMFHGAIGVCPMNSLRWHRWDREINLLLLNLDLGLLTRNALELLETDRVELLSRFVIEDPLIHQIGLALKTELQSNGSGGQLYAETMANALAVHLLRRYSTQGHQTIVCKGGLPQHKLRLVTDYINDYLERELSLDELSMIAQLSPYYFSRAFKKSTGISPHQYVIKQRVERAKRLLLQEKMSLADIAIACGFSHQSHLNRHFKRLTGVTPKTLLKS